MNNATPLPPFSASKKTKHSLKSMVVIGSMLITLFAIGVGISLTTSKLLLSSKATTAFNPIDKRPYSGCWSPFQTDLSGASFTISCDNMPKVSIDVWRMNGSFDNQTLVWHGEWDVVRGTNTLSIPSGTFQCGQYYQIDTWTGSGSPPSGANYGYSLITATFVKPIGASCGPIPSAHCPGGATIDGPSSCLSPTATPRPPTPTTQPTPRPTTPPGITPTVTPRPTATPTPIPTVTPSPRPTTPPGVTPTVTPPPACIVPPPVTGVYIRCPACSTI